MTGRTVDRPVRNPDRYRTGPDRTGTERPVAGTGSIYDMHSAETDNPSRNRAHLFSREILINPPSSLRHVIFQIPYNHPELIDCPIVNSYITNIELNFSGAHNNRSIYVLIYIFRLHQSLQHIRVVFENYIKPGCIYVG